MAKVLVEQTMFQDVYGSIVNEGTLKYLFDTKKEAYEYLESTGNNKKVRKDFYIDKQVDEDGLDYWIESKVMWTRGKYEYVAGKDLHLVI